MEDIRIVTARESDAHLMAEYRFAMFVDMYPDTDFSGIKREFMDQALRYFACSLLSPDQLSVFAKAGDKTVGCGTIMFQQRPPSVKHMSNLYGYILNIYVHPDFRRHGVATRIMKVLAAEAESRGARRIGLHASDVGAGVYSKLGYVTKQSYMETDL
jgi:ribosomal protein S18 acetylase RimI-like enzyme